MRLLPKACAWCHQVIWPWQRMLRHMHLDPCWLAVERMYVEDQRRYGA